MSAHAMSPLPPVTRRQRARATRALGYTIAAVVNSVLLYLVNVAPGWQAVPFLSDSAVDVVPALNAALTVGIVGNVVNVAVDRRWMRALTDLLASGASLVFIVMTWRVFPFDFGSPDVDGELITRTVLVFAAIGCLIGIAAAIVVLVAEAWRSWVTPEGTSPRA